MYQPPLRDRNFFTFGLIYYIAKDFGSLDSDGVLNISKLQTSARSYCRKVYIIGIFHGTPPFLRKAKGHSIRHFRPSAIPSVRPPSSSRYLVLVVNSSYSFMPIHLKLYRCLDHCLKMCILFGYNPRITYVTFSQVELSHFYGQKVWSQGILCGQLLLQFYANSFKNLTDV